MQPKFDVFISHSSKDKSQADLLWKALEKRGYKCWIAPSSILPAEKWPEAIRRGVSESRVIALLFSRNSDKSEEVETELFYAKKKFSVPIISIRIEDVEPEKLEHFIWNVQWIPAVEPPLKEQMDDVINQIERALDNSPKTRNTEEIAEEFEKPALAPGQIEAEIAAPQVQRKSNSILQGVLTARGQGRESKIYAAIEAGETDTEAVDRFGQTALHYVAKAKIKLKPNSEQMGILRLWLQQEPNLDAVAIDGTTPLHLAAQHNNVDAARLLLFRGAKPSPKNQNGQTPLDLARDSRALDTIHLLELFQKPSSAKANTALRAALDSYNHKSSKILDAIAAGADDYSMRDAAERTPLHWAAQENEPELVQLLLDQGADVWAQDNKRNTSAKLARNKGCTEIEKMLQEWEKSHLASKDKKPSAGSGEKGVVKPEPVIITPKPSLANGNLQAALDMGPGPSKGKAVLSAIRGGVTDFSLTDKFGRTALHWAAMKDDAQAAKIVLVGGADVNTVGATGADKGKTALDLAKENGATEVIALLSSHEPVSPQKPFDVFISHANEDSQAAVELYEALEAENLSCWLDKKQKFDNYTLDIRRGIQSSATLVLLASKAANRPRSGVVAECSMALEREIDIPIYPILIEEVELRNLEHLDYYLSFPTERLYAFSHPNAQPLQNIARIIKARVDGEKSANASDSKPAPKSLSPADARLQAALQSPAANRAREVVRAIESGATDYSLTDDMGRTALHWAVEANDLEAVQKALKAGANVNAAAKNGQTPLDVATSHSLVWMAKELRNQGAK